MTPPAASTSFGAARFRSAPVRGRRPAPVRRGAVIPRGARRVSGPAAGLSGLRGPGMPAVAGAGSLSTGAAAYTPLGLRIARRAAGVQDARLLDRLIRGRLWIGLIAVMLIGLVFLQLSLLSLNAGIGDAMQKSSVLQRENSALATQISQMDAGQRVQDVAAEQGMVMPGAGSVHYRTAGTVSAAVAARGIAAPTDAAKALAGTGGTAATATAAGATTPGATTTGTAGAPATAAATATTTPAAPTATATTATATAAPATTSAPVTPTPSAPLATTPAPSATAPPTGGATAPATPQG